MGSKELSRAWSCRCLVDIHQGGADRGSGRERGGGFLAICPSLFGATALLPPYQHWSVSNRAGWLFVPPLLDFGRTTTDDMENLDSPSPGPSFQEDGLPHGFPALIQHNAALSFPRNPTPVGHHYDSQPQSRYSSPGPQHGLPYDHDTPMTQASYGPPYGYHPGYPLDQSPYPDLPSIPVGVTSMYDELHPGQKPGL